MTTSSHLEAIIQERESATNLQVVFTDVVAYSKRRTVSQKAVVDAFTSSLQQALNEVAAAHVDYLRRGNLNFSTDVLRIPTGDGAAVAFSFDGLHEVHFEFAATLLRIVHARNALQPCPIYDRESWCNCHDNFGLRIGIALGKTVIFRDMNGNFNAAGTAMNLAARVMGQVDISQIAVAKDAYDQLVDMADDPKLGEQFTVFHNVRLKHGFLADIYQYTPQNLDYISSKMPERLQQLTELTTAAEMLQKLSPMASVGFPDLLKMDPKELPALATRLGEFVRASIAEDDRRQAEMKRLFKAEASPAGSAE